MNLRSALAWLAGVGAALTPVLAEACPACATRQDGGFGQTAALGALLIVPFAVSAVVYRFVRSHGDDSPYVSPQDSPPSGPRQLAAPTPKSMTTRSGTE